MATLSQFDALLAEVQRMRDEHVRLQEENERLKSASKPDPVYPVGSKHIWMDRPYSQTLEGRLQHRRVVAIQMKDGILQVKDVTTGMNAQGSYNDSKCDYTKKLYTSLDAWRSSLPEGEVKSESADGLSDLQRRLKTPFPTAEATGDCDALRIFCRRWRVHNYAVEERSPAEALEYFRKAFKDMQHDVAYIPTQGNVDMEAAKNTLRKMNKLKGYYRRILYLQEHNKTLTAEQLHERYAWTRLRYRARLYAFIKGERRNIVLNQKYYGSDDPEFMFCSGRKATSFAGLGIDLKPDGTPVLELEYRTNTYRF